MYSTRELPLLGRSPFHVRAVHHVMPTRIVTRALAILLSVTHSISGADNNSLCIVGGPTLSPIIGSAVSESYLTWRWTEYIVVILTSFVLALDIFFLPETSSAVILTRRARTLRMKTKNWALHSKHEEVDHSISVFMHKTLYTPLKMLVREPMVTLITT